MINKEICRRVNRDIPNYREVNGYGFGMFKDAKYTDMPILEGIDFKAPRMSIVLNHASIIKRK